MRPSLLDFLPGPSVPPPAPCHAPEGKSWVLFLSPDDPLVCLAAFLQLHHEPRGPFSRRTRVAHLGMEAPTWGYAPALLEAMLSYVSELTGIPRERFLDPRPGQRDSFGRIFTTTAGRGETRPFLPGPFPAERLIKTHAFGAMFPHDSRIASCEATAIAEHSHGAEHGPAA